MSCHASIRQEEFLELSSLASLGDPFGDSVDGAGFSSGDEVLLPWINSSRRCPKSPKPSILLSLFWKCSASRCILRMISTVQT